MLSIPRSIPEKLAKVSEGIQGGKGEQERAVEIMRR
jgi:hypothetical protein